MKVFGRVRVGLQRNLPVRPGPTMLPAEFPTILSAIILGRTDRALAAHVERIRRAKHGGRDQEAHAQFPHLRFSKHQAGQ